MYENQLLYSSNWSVIIESIFSRNLKAHSLKFQLQRTILEETLACQIKISIRSVDIASVMNKVTMLNVTIPLANITAMERVSLVLSKMKIMSITIVTTPRMKTK